MDIIYFIRACQMVELDEDKHVPEILNFPSYDMEEMELEEVTVETEEVFVSFEIDNEPESNISLTPVANSKPNRKFICEYCGTAYRRKDTLKQHLLTHRVYPSQKEKHQIYTCPHCNAEFYYLSTYTTHVNIVHSQDRPHQCDRCQRSYKKKDSLDRHKLMHQNNRSFCCTLCSSTFNRQSDLKYHSRIHRERKIYSCYLCEAKYVTLTNLKSHLLTIHEDKRPFICETCGYAFRTKATMIKHSKSCVKVE